MTRITEIRERWRLGNDEHADADVQYLLAQITERDAEIEYLRKLKTELRRSLAKHEPLEANNPA